MFKKKYLGLAIAATLAAGSAQAALETSVTLKNETAYMMKDGIRTGEATSTTDTTGEGKGVYKFENTAKIFLNDELDNGMSWHGELNIVRDTKAINDYKGHETNTQRDWLRELYVDTKAGDWDLRIGKQQVVWGTADGIKLLDMINPTDWSEFNQNTMAESRIPVWMMNAEKYLDSGANIQVIVSQAETNKIAGIGNSSAKATSHTSGDSGHPFVMKGADAISGRVNGFLNIAPALGKVAAFFADAGDGTANGTIASAGLFAYQASTVNDFVNNDSDATNFFGMCGSGNPGSAACLSNIANSSVMGQNAYVTNLDDWSNGTYDTTNPNSAFELMDQAAFATFYTMANLTSEYRVKHPDNEGNLAFRFRNSTANGINYSANYAYRYDSNPYVDLSWEDQNGNPLTVKYGSGTTTLLGANPNLSPNDDATYVYLHDGTDMLNPVAGEKANLVFTEKLQRINTLGGSFDYAIDTESNPVILRGEFVYEKGVKTPVVNRAALAIGDLLEGLKSEEADFFKYVIGADTTVMTDMMLSGQFIQFRNLDYVDETSTPSRNGVTSIVSGQRYTADMATLNVTNGLQKAEENKNFYSVFLSKPFGESGEGRWNNIFIFEEGGGKWNRFDLEYGFDDQLIGTFEVNKYFGDNNTMFGQFENASNVQIGLKYLLH